VGAIILLNLHVAVVELWKLTQFAFQGVLSNHTKALVTNQNGNFEGMMLLQVTHIGNGLNSRSTLKTWLLSSSIFFGWNFGLFIRMLAGVGAASSFVVVVNVTRCFTCSSSSCLAEHGCALMSDDARINLVKGT